VDEEKAMTELMEAVADVRAQPERLARLGAALIDALKSGKRQKDLVTATGYTRESIRRLVEEERIRRGEIPPTARYLKAQRRQS
jgi:hypothetical protein